MKPSKLLFGNIPKEHWELQLKLSNERILLAIYGAIEFWENLKKEAEENIC